MKHITLTIAALLFSINSYAAPVTIDKPDPNITSLWSKKIFNDEKIFILTNESCSIPELLDDNYNYNAMLVIPTESLADKRIAYETMDNGLALVSIGCWNYLSGAIYLINHQPEKVIMFDLPPIDETWIKSTINR